jgi:hypothetical protein
MTAKLSPQSVRVLDILTTTRSLTPVLALTVYHIGSLSKRIADLRKAGYGIEGTRRYDAYGRSYIEYRLVSTPTEREKAMWDV